MSIQELLNLGEPIFKQIDEAVTTGDYDKAHALLNYPQPPEWIKDMPSEATDGIYYHNDIELIEGICDRVFHKWSYEIQSTTLTPTKSGIAITITSIVIYKFKGEPLYQRVSGVATEFVTNSKMLPLATPKCATMSMKNGAKKIGRLFGRDLNRGIENAPIEPTENGKEIIVDTTLLHFAKGIDDASTIEELSSLKKGLPPSLNSAYMNKLKELTKPIK